MRFLTGFGSPMTITISKIAGRFCCQSGRSHFCCWELLLGDDYPLFTWTESIDFMFDGNRINSGVQTILSNPYYRNPSQRFFRCFICHVPCVFLLLCLGKHYFPSIIQHHYFHLLFPIYLSMMSHLFVHSSPNIAMIYHPLNVPHMIPMRTCPWFYIERPSCVRCFLFTHLTLTIVIPYPAEAYQSWVIAVGNPKSCQACRLVYIFISSL